LFRTAHMVGRRSIALIPRAVKKNINNSRKSSIAGNHTAELPYAATPFLELYLSLFGDWSAISRKNERV
jgi:hypothetical protein